MNATQLEEEILRLSVEERIRLVQNISDSIAADSEPEPLSDDHVGIVQRRIAANRADPSRAIPWDEAIARLRERHG